MRVILFLSMMLFFVSCATSSYNRQTSSSDGVGLCADDDSTRERIEDDIEGTKVDVFDELGRLAADIVLFDPTQEVLEAVGNGGAEVKGEGTGVALDGVGV